MSYKTCVHSETVAEIYTQINDCAQPYISERELEFMYVMTQDTRQTLLMALGYVIQTLHFQLVYQSCPEEKVRLTLDACHQQVQALIESNP